jgi:hypothetical protein
MAACQLKAQIWGQNLIPESRQIDWISGTFYALCPASAEANAQESAQVPAHARLRPAFNSQLAELGLDSS